MVRLRRPSLLGGPMGLLGPVLVVVAGRSSRRLSGGDVHGYDMAQLPATLVVSRITKDVEEWSEVEERNKVEECGDTWSPTPSTSGIDIDDRSPVSGEDQQRELR